MSGIIREYNENTLGLAGSGEASAKKMYERMQSKMNMDIFKNSNTIMRDENSLGLLAEGAQIAQTDIPQNASKYMLEDINALNSTMPNVANAILQEAVQGTDNLSPIIINSFGIQERALIGCHLPKAVKQITAKVDNFKLTERFPFIVDLAGNKSKFIDAFVPGTTEAATLMANLKEEKDLKVAPGSMGVDLYTTLSVDTARKFGFDSYVNSFKITDPTDNTVTITTVSYDKYTVRTPNVENGTFEIKISYTDKAGTSHAAYVSGQFDFANGKLNFVNSSDANITEVGFKMVLSPETHHTALQVGYDIKHTPVHIPIGEHFEYSLSEEFRDAADKYYNVDAMALLTDYMGKAVEQVKDIKVLNKFQELGNAAIFKGTFDCVAPSGFTQGNEEYIKRQFNPYIEKVCILLKNMTRITNCNFRVVGNPMDIRVGGAAGVEYIYRRNEQFVGDITLDYEFSVTSDVHKIFYLSSERVPQGKIWIFLIPNTIENNISTVNHYEYATYVSNKYKGTKSNLPSVMISTRYQTKEYFPVVAEIDMKNNMPA